MSHFDLLWKAPLDDLKQGYHFQESTGEYVCLACGKPFEKGIIYTDGGTFYEAEKFAALHIVKEHGSMFDFLLGLDKKLTGLSDLQKSLLRLFYDGCTDNEIVAKLDGGSASTIRNHRFALREKEKQAKLFLAIMELLERKNGGARGQGKSSAKKTPPQGLKTATGRDERFDLTEEEYQETVLTYFPEGLEGPVSSFPAKEKRRYAVLRHLLHRFQPGRRYTEKQVNDILQEAYHDYALLRRYMIEYGFLDREADGSAYWMKDGVPAMTAERRKQLLLAYKQLKRSMGVFRIRNKVNGKSLVGSSINLDALWNRTRFLLNMKVYDNKRLQLEWDDYGSEAFAFEVLEQLEEPKESRKDTGALLKAMEAGWVERLQPFGDSGYNGL